MRTIDILPNIVRIRQPVRRALVWRRKISVYLPERVIKALRPNVSASIDALLNDYRPRRTKKPVRWARLPIDVGPMRKTTICTRHRVSGHDVAHAIYCWLEAKCNDLFSGGSDHNPLQAGTNKTGRSHGRLRDRQHLASVSHSA